MGFVRNWYILHKFENDLEESDPHDRNSERTKYLTSAMTSFTRVLIDLGVVFASSDPSSRGVAILGCDSHSQASSASVNKKLSLSLASKYSFLWKYV